MVNQRHIRIIICVTLYKFILKMIIIRFVVLLSIIKFSNNILCVFALMVRLVRYFTLQDLIIQNIENEEYNQIP